MDENDKYIPEEWNEHQRKVAEIKAAAGTDAEPDLYRDVKQDGYNFAGIFCIVAGLVAMFILGAMGSKHLAPKIFFGGLFIGSVLMFIGYFMPYHNLCRRMRYLKKRCTVQVVGRCVRTGEIPYGIARQAQVIMPFYRTPDEEDKHINEEMYYDPEYVIEFQGQTYHLCEHRYHLFETKLDSERTLLIDPDSPKVFYDERRYLSERSFAKERMTQGIPSRVVFIVITAILAKLFIL
ncbi:MAG: hypothetical protein KBI35_04025 [Ruminococcus sp.]|nr:hypothetical protein [Ruminococcus sp.]MBQ8122451.1 hypothetical protein [Ruminococcus sp.]